VHCHFANNIKKSADGGVLPHHKWQAANKKFIKSSFNVFPFTGQGCLFPTPVPLIKKSLIKRSVLIFLRIMMMHGSRE